MTAVHTDSLANGTGHLRPDGTVFPPVTPDPPTPPGYVSPVDGNPELELEGASRGDRTGTTKDQQMGAPAATPDPDQPSRGPAVDEPHPSV